VREKMKLMSPRQDKELLAAVVRQFPYGLVSAERAQFLISEAQDQLQGILTNALNFDSARYFRSLLAACRQDEVGHYFNSDCFPVEPLASDEEEWVECLYVFPGDVVGMQALQDLRKLGYRPCGVRRAMKYLARNPGLQDRNPIVLTSVGTDELEYCLPVFCRDWRHAKRCILLNNVDCTFGTDYRWLVLCPRAAAPPVEMGLLALYDACRIDKWQAFIGQERPSILEEVAPADGWELHVHHFTETVTGEHAMCVHGLTMCDYRYLGGMRRGLEYIARLKDLPCPLALSFEVQDAHGHRCIPLVWQTGLTRRLRLVPIEKNFPPSIGWFVLRSKAKQEEK
jgi:hypothetical protein